MRIKVNSLRLDSVVKIFVLAGASLGLALGILLFLLSLVSDSVVFNFGAITYTGIKGGLGNLIGMPIMLSIAAAILSLFAHFPIKLVLKLQKGQIIEGEFEVLEGRIADLKLTSEDTAR